MAKNRKPVFLREWGDLPLRVKENAASRLDRGEAMQLAALTAFRPNGDMPFAWFLVTSKQVMLCSTHRGRGVYAAHPLTEINSVRLEGNGRVLRILVNDLASGNDLTILLHPEIPAAHIEIVAETVHSIKA